jgi:hypothetical protein
MTGQTRDIRHEIALAARQQANGTQEGKHPPVEKIGGSRAMVTANGAQGDSTPASGELSSVIPPEMASGEGKPDAT